MLQLAATETAKFACEAAPLFNIIANIETWPLWWPANYKFGQLAITPDWVGSIVQVTPPKGKAYYCEISRLAAFSEIDIRYFADQKKLGSGIWRFKSSMTDIIVSHTINLQLFPSTLTLPMMARKKHHAFMNQVFRGLARYGDQRLVV